MHGPEHHMIVPCVLLTAYKNCGGEIDLGKALDEAVKRGKNVPGGACGYWGACGAAVSTGIYMSIVTGSGPLNGDAWPVPMKLVAKCLEDIAACGGPRCCKRTCRLAIKRAAEFTKETLGVEMPVSDVKCGYFTKNRECIHSACPFFPDNRLQRI